MQKRYYNIDDYIITRDGQIINKHNGRILKPQKNGKGYLRISIGKKLMFVHRLVATQYIENPNNLPQVNHKDGNKLNNNYTNLEWVSNKTNREHAVMMNLHISGEQCQNHKLTEEDVLYIRKCNNMTNVELSKKFNVSHTTISDVKLHRTWKQLKRYADL